MHRRNQGVIVLLFILLGIIIFAIYDIEAGGSGSGEDTGGAAAAGESGPGPGGEQPARARRSARTARRMVVLRGRW